MPLYSQSKHKTNLSTPFTSLEVLSKALIRRDSILVSNIVTDEGYNNILNQNLFMFGEKWLGMIRKKRVTVFHDSKKLQILKIDQEDYLLNFILDDTTHQWKFTAFITKP